MSARTRIGVLALQGAFAAHASVLARLGVDTREVRTTEDLEQCDALVMPGGESTTMSKLLETSQIFDPLGKRIADGMPVFGTCAGMILLAGEVEDPRSDQRSLGALDISVRRNAYGRQVDSFETEISLRGLSPAYHAVFIRAPRITRCGKGVEVLAEHDGVAVLVCSGAVMAASFHPELTDDDRVHRMFLDVVAGRAG
jgi:5'-phosphate synthase pdxT subunit